jgi:hypothetical protein
LCAFSLIEAQALLVEDASIKINTVCEKELHMRQQAGWVKHARITMDVPH